MQQMKNSAISSLGELHFLLWREQHPTIDIKYYAKRKYTDKTANGLTRCIIDLTQFMGYQAERVSSEGRIIGKKELITDCVGRQKVIGSVKRVYSNTTNGTADIAATICGRSVKIEVKIGADQQSEAQRKYQETVEVAGGIYLIVKDFSSYFNWLNQFVLGEKAKKLLKVEKNSEPNILQS